METRTIEQEQQYLEGTAQKPISIYTLYKTMEIDPSAPGAADRIRTASLKMIGALKNSPELVNAIVRAGLAAEYYEKLDSGFVRSAQDPIRKA